MKNRTKKYVEKNVIGPRSWLNWLALKEQNELLNKAEVGLDSQLFKLIKTEEEILIDLFGKLSIPITSLNETPSPFKQS